MPSTRSKAGGGGCGCGAAVAVLRAGVVAEVDNACGGHGGLEEEVVSESDTLMCVCRLLAQRRDWSPTHGRALRGRHSAAPHGGRACHPKQSLLVPCHKHQLPTRLPPPSPPQASRANAAQNFCYAIRDCPPILHVHAFVVHFRPSFTHLLNNIIHHAGTKDGTRRAAPTPTTSRTDHLSCGLGEEQPVTTKQGNEREITGHGKPRIIRRLFG